MLLLRFGEVAEWSKAAVLKTVDPKGSGGSNPSLSARLFQWGFACRLFCHIGLEFPVQQPFRCLNANFREGEHSRIAATVLPR